MVNVTGAYSQCHGCAQILSVNHTQSMSPVQFVNVTGAERQAFLYLLREWSMSRVHTDTECKSHSVNVTGANCQCHGCIQILCVNHTQSMSRVQIVNVTGAETQAFLYLLRGWSMSRVHIVNVTGAHRY